MAEAARVSGWVRARYPKRSAHSASGVTEPDLVLPAATSDELAHRDRPEGFRL